MYELGYWVLSMYEDLFVIVQEVSINCMHVPALLHAVSYSYYKCTLHNPYTACGLLHLLEHEGKKEISVRRDDFVKGSPDNPWPEVFDKFSEQIRKHVGDKTHALLTPEFSTTGPTEKAAAQVVLMDSFKKYFSFKCITRCVIPEITLAGTVDDWKKLRDRVLGLAQYDLDWWISALKPVLV